MRNFILAKANMKRQKGSFIGILLLVFIVTVSLCSVLAIWNNAHDYEAEQIDRIGYGDICAWVLDSYAETLTEQILAVEDVEKVELQDFIGLGSFYISGDYVGEATVFIMPYNEDYVYYVYNESLTEKLEQPEGLKEGEVYVPATFSYLYDAEIGDLIEMDTGEGNLCGFTIRGFFEDPVMGSALVGIKTILMSEADMERLHEEMGETCGSMLHIYKKADSGLSEGEFQALLNEETEISAWGLRAYQKSVITKFMLILQDIISGIMLVFVVVLLITTILVIGYAINSSVEQDYVDMGILKALGFTVRDLRLSQMIQYMAAALVGMGAGIPAASLAVRVINKMTVGATGLMIPEELPAGLVSAALGVILLFLAGFICVQTAKIGKITPIRALRGGAEDVYFKSRFAAPVLKKGLGFWLALRQIVSGKKQYGNVVVIAAVLVFFLSLIGRIDAWLGDDGEGLLDQMQPFSADFLVWYEDADTRQEADELIAAHADVENRFEVVMTSAALDGVDYLMYIISQPEAYHVVEGRTCLYDNELVVTESVAQALGAGIGDSVEVLYEGERTEFIISGIYQSMNDLGSNFGVSAAGFLRLAPDAGETPFYTAYQLKDSSQKDTVLALLEDAFEDLAIEDNAWSGKDGVVLAMTALEFLMYIITTVFIFVAVVMTGNKVLYREQRDLGIYKSLGFGSGRLGLAFALRFAIVSAAGAVLGTLLSAWLTDPAVSAVLKFCGLSRFVSTQSPGRLIFPGIFVTLLFFSLAYLAARKIKNVDPAILIVE